MKLDVLSFAAHRDDTEITCGGTLIKLVSQGHAVGACDLTAGEMGTYGSAAERQHECEEATKRMGLAVRVNCELPDAGLFNTREQQKVVVEVLRKHRPSVVILPGLDQRHPDHAVCPRLVFDACYFAGLKKFGKGEPHRPRKIIYVHNQYAPHPPSYVVDITDQLEKKLEAVSAYESQFPKIGQKGIASRDELFGWIRDRARSYGMMIGKKYGEGFHQREILEVPDLSAVPGSSI